MVGLGDLVARAAKPAAAFIDRLAGTNLTDCGGCAARQDQLNRMMPFKNP